MQQPGALVIVDALDLIEITDARHAVGLGLQRILRIEELRVLESCGAGAGDEVEKRLEVASSCEGQFRHVGRVNFGADVGTVRLKLWRCRGHSHGLRDTSRCER